MGIKVKSATLTPGRWIYVCPCGAQSTVCRVDRKENKWMVYCFSCKQQIGKYYRVMDERIEFDENYNNKLNCPSFPLVRLNHPVKNAVGAIKQIYLKGLWKGNAKIVILNHFRLDQITPAISKLDANMVLEDYRRWIHLQYKKYPQINWDTQLLDFIVLEYCKESKEPTLFK